jgi:hypothetical protein
VTVDTVVVVTIVAIISPLKYFNYITMSNAKKPPAAFCNASERERVRAASLKPCRGVCPVLSFGIHVTWGDKVILGYYSTFAA